MSVVIFNALLKKYRLLKRAARFMSNDFTSRSEGCVTEIIQSLEWTSLADRRKVRRISILQARLDHFSLPIGNLLQPVQRQSHHLHSNAYTTPSASKDSYKYSYFPRTIIDFNFLPEHLTQTELIPQFKEAVPVQQITCKQLNNSKTSEQYFMRTHQPDRLTPWSVGQYIIKIKTQELLGQLKFWCYFWVPW